MRTHHRRTQHSQPKKGANQHAWLRLSNVDLRNTNKFRLTPIHYGCYIVTQMNGSDHSLVERSICQPKFGSVAYFDVWQSKHRVNSYPFDCECKTKRTRIFCTIHIYLYVCMYTSDIKCAHAYIHYFIRRWYCCRCHINTHARNTLIYLTLLQ